MVIEGRAPVAGGIRSAASPSPSAVVNWAQTMAPPAASSSGEMRASAVRCAPWIGGEVGGAVFPCPSAVVNRVQAMSPSAASSAERRSSATRRVSWVGGAVLPSSSAAENRAQAMSPPPASSSAERRSSATRRAPWVGGGVEGAVFPSPSAVVNRVQAMSPSAAPSAERRDSAARRASAATRSPLSAVSINTTRRAVPSAAGKVRKAAAPPVAKPGRGSLTRCGIVRYGTVLYGTVLCGMVTRVAAATSSEIYSTTWYLVPLFFLRVRRLWVEGEG